MPEEELKAELKERGFDGVILISNAGVYKGGIEYVSNKKGGFLMFVTYSMLGTEYREILAQYNVVLFDLLKDKTVCSSGHSQNENKFQNEIQIPLKV